MADITGKRGSKVTMFPVALDGLIPPSTLVASARAFVNQLEMAELGFPRSASAKTGRPG